jgi:NAD(P)-dependent dehydrogenase (short-subunit alcohol dehydrogenase family)
MSVQDKVAVVTGATKGVGRGVASALAQQGARVFITGRSASDNAPIDERTTAIHCDHRDDVQVDSAFQHIVREAGTIDILVNNVWGGYDNMLENGQFTWPKPFWEQPLWRWDAMFCRRRSSALPSEPAGRAGHDRAGPRADREHFILSAQKHIGNVATGFKAATDKLTADMATELARHGVAVVSLPHSGPGQNGKTWKHRSGST